MIQITFFFHLISPSAHSDIDRTVLKDCDKMKLLDSFVAEVRETLKEEETAFNTLHNA